MCWAYASYAAAADTIPIPSAFIGESATYVILRHVSSYSTISGGSGKTFAIQNKMLAEVIQVVGRTCWRSNRYTYSSESRSVGDTD